MVVSALKGRGVAEVIANARQVSTAAYVCPKEINYRLNCVVKLI